MIGGFIQPTTGDIIIEGRNVTRLGPDKRPTNMVFQGYGLFPHMTVRQNIAYGPRIAKVPPPELERRIDEAIALVRLEGFDHRSISELSGGQQQRVALARALVMRPPVLLLDEPLAALDLKLRQAMQEELRRIHQQIGGTFVFVTHDQGEAMSLANRVAVMDQGRLLQVGPPEEVYRHPRSVFVATFIGEANVFAGARQNGMVQLRSGPRFPDSGPDSEVVVIVRPETMTIDIGGAPPNALHAHGRITEKVFLGSVVRYAVQLDGGQTIVVQDSSEQAQTDLVAGMPVAVAWSSAAQSVLSS
jgi:ABC-type Fe3+/spermidine/putrescine transport system ATPase subunit